VADDGHDRRSAPGIDHSLGRDPDDARTAARRLGVGRFTKASSAEAILRHTLRQLGLTRIYHRGELTGPQALELLAAIREYGRAWMHHEALALVQDHGTERALGAATRHHVGRFFRRAGQFVRELILAGAMALAGPEGLTSADLEEADRRADAQVAYLDRFEQDVETRGPAQLSLEPVPEAMSAAEFAARAELYGNAAWTDGQHVMRAHWQRAGAIRERRVHVGADLPCAQCRDQVALGWQAPGRLLPIGDCTCKMSCHCHFELQDADGRIRWVGGRVA
jgi:hypothetical protein